MTEAQLKAAVEKFEALAREQSARSDRIKEQGDFVDYDALETPEQLFALVDAAVQTDRETLRASTERIRAIERRNQETARRLLGCAEGGAEP